MRITMALWHQMDISYTLHELVWQFNLLDLLVSDAEKAFKSCYIKWRAPNSNLLSTVANLEKREMWDKPHLTPSMGLSKLCCFNYFLRSGIEPNYIPPQFSILFTPSLKAIIRSENSIDKCLKV